MNGIVLDGVNAGNNDKKGEIKEETSEKRPLNVFTIIIAVFTFLLGGIALYFLFFGSPLVDIEESSTETEETTEEAEATGQFHIIQDFVQYDDDGNYVTVTLFYQNELVKTIRKEATISDDHIFKFNEDFTRAYFIDEDNAKFKSIGSDKKEKTEYIAPNGYKHLSSFAVRDDGSWVLLAHTEKPTAQNFDSIETLLVEDGSESPFTDNEVLVQSYNDTYYVFQNNITGVGVGGGAISYKVVDRESLESATDKSGTILYSNEHYVVHRAICDIGPCLRPLVKLDLDSLETENILEKTAAVSAIDIFPNHLVVNWMTYSNQAEMEEDIAAGSDAFDLISEGMEVQHKSVVDR